MTRVIHYDHLTTPLGRILLVATEGGLAGVYFTEHAHAPLPEPTWAHDPAALEPAASQLCEYFSGARASFDLALAARGTPFQLRVWQALRTIPFGATQSYGELAARLGVPGSARAVGSANARNPLSIIVPCHRVIAASGALSGYAGGSYNKAWLLAFERSPARSAPLTAPRKSCQESDKKIVARLLALV